LNKKQLDNWKKFKLNDKLRQPKVAVSIALFASLSLGWIAGYNSAINVDLNDNQAVENREK
jgi:hypothetical protein